MEIKELEKEIKRLRKGIKKELNHHKEMSKYFPLMRSFSLRVEILQDLLENTGRFKLVDN